MVKQMVANSSRECCAAVKNNEEKLYASSWNISKTLNLKSKSENYVHYMTPFRLKDITLSYPIISICQIYTFYL